MKCIANVGYLPSWVQTSIPTLHTLLLKQLLLYVGAILHAKDIEYFLFLSLANICLSVSYKDSMMPILFFHTRLDRTVGVVGI